jgi:hypothetical protein
MIITESMYENMETLSNDISEYIINNGRKFRKEPFNAYDYIIKYLDAQIKENRDTAGTERYIKIKNNLLKDRAKNAPAGKYAVYIYAYGGRDETAAAYEQEFDKIHEIKVFIPAYSNRMPVYAGDSSFVSKANSQQRKHIRDDIRHEFTHVFDRLRHSGAGHYVEKGRGKEFKYEYSLMNKLGDDDDQDKQIRHDIVHNKFKYDNDKKYIKHRIEFEQYMQRFFRRCEGMTDAQPVLNIRSYRQMLMIIFGNLYHPGFENDEQVKRMVKARCEEENFPDDPKFKKVKISGFIINPAPVDVNNRIMSSVFGY